MVFDDGGKKKEKKILLAVSNVGIKAAPMSNDYCPLFLGGLQAKSSQMERKQMQKQSGTRPSKRGTVERIERNRGPIIQSSSIKSFAEIISNGLKGTFMGDTALGNLLTKS